MDIYKEILTTFDRKKLSCSGTFLLRIFKKNKINKILSLLSQKILKIKQNHYFVIYCLIYNNNTLIKTYEIEINTYIDRLLKKNKKDKFLFLQNFLQESKLSKATNFNDYKINFYLFSNQNKEDKKNFSKIYQLIKDQLFFYRDEYDKKYFGTGIDILFNFFLDSSSFLRKNILIVSGFLLVYTLFYYQLVLELLGIPFSTISTVILSMNIKIFFGIAIFSMYPLLIPLIVYILGFISMKINKQFIYSILSMLAILVFYSYIGIFVMSLNYFDLAKDKINTHMHVFTKNLLKNYFIMNQNIRIMTKDSSTILAVGTDDKFLYYYPLQKLCLDFNQSKKQSSYNDDVEMIINLLSNSKYADIRNVQMVPMEKISELFIVHDINESRKLITEQCYE